MNSLLSFLLESSICLSIVFGFYYVFLRRQNRYLLNRAYLLSGLIVSLIIPFLSFDVFPIAIVEPIPFSETTSEPESNRNIQAFTTESFSYYSLLILIYSLGLSAILINFLLRLKRLTDLIKSGEKENYESYTLVRLQNETQISSFFKYIFISKEEAISHEILQHEMVHIRQWHSLDILLMECINCILWFNPFIYWYKKELRLNHEYISDKIAINHSGFDNYLNALHDYTSRVQVVHLRNPFSYSLKKRLNMLKHQDRNNKSIAVYFFSFPLILLLLCLFSFDNYYVNETPIEMDISNDTLPEYAYDTIVVFDPNTYEERVTVYKRKLDQCYSMFWGILKFNIDPDQKEFKVNKARLEEASRSSFKIIRDNQTCQSINEFSFKIVLMAKDKDPMMQVIRKNNLQLNSELQLLLSEINSGTLYIEDLTINNKSEGNFVIKF